MEAPPGPQPASPLWEWAPRRRGLGGPQTDPARLMVRPRQACTRDGEAGDLWEPGAPREAGSREGPVAHRARGRRGCPGMGGSSRDRGYYCPAAAEPAWPVQGPAPRRGPTGCPLRVPAPLGGCSHAVPLTAHTVCLRHTIVLPTHVLQKAPSRPLLRRGACACGRTLADPPHAHVHAHPLCEPGARPGAGGCRQDALGPRQGDTGWRMWGSWGPPLQGLRPMREAWAAAAPQRARRRALRQLWGSKWAGRWGPLARQPASGNSLFVNLSSLREHTLLTCIRLAVYYYFHAFIRKPLNDLFSNAPSVRRGNHRNKGSWGFRSLLRVDSGLS